MCKDLTWLLLECCVVFSQRVPYYDIVIINLLFSFFTAMNTSFNLNSFAVKATLCRQS